MNQESDKIQLIYRPPDGDPSSPQSIQLTRLTDDEWKNMLNDHMSSFNWVCDRDDETTLGFSWKKDDEHWVRDYNKTTRSFVQFDANHRVTLRVSKETE